MRAIRRLAALPFVLIVLGAPQAHANTVTGLAVAPAKAVAGSTVTATVSGAAGYCGAVHINWGDGSAITYATETLPVTQTHAYKSAGTFAVRAQGMGNCTGEATAQVVITPAPVVSRLTAIQVSPTPAPVKTPVTIAMQGSGTCRLTLDFGDGNRQELERGLPATVPHTYTQPGVYTVAATPAGGCGERQTARLEIVAPDAPARLTGLEIGVEGAAPGGRRSIRVGGSGRCTYTLDYGDGNSETRTETLPDTASHNYPAAGRYVITATAAAPCSGSARSTVTVGQPGADAAGRDLRGRIGRVEVRPQVVRAGEAVAITVGGSGTCRLTIDFHDGESRTVTQALPYRLTYRYANPGDYEIVVWTDEPCSGEGDVLVRVRQR